jgi:hypothetical protein
MRHSALALPAAFGPPAVPTTSPREETWAGALERQSPSATAQARALTPSVLAADPASARCWWPRNRSTNSKHRSKLAARGLRIGAVLIEPTHSVGRRGPMP